MTNVFNNVASNLITFSLAIFRAPHKKYTESIKSIIFDVKIDDQRSEKVDTILNFIN